MAAILFERADLDQKPNSTLSRVTVYQGRAQAFRTMRTRLSAGMQTVVFTSLGREIEEGSIRAHTGDKRARIISVALERKDLYFFNKAENEKTYNEVVDALKKLIGLGDGKTILAVEAGLIADLRLYLERALNDILLEQGTAITRLREALDFLRDLLDRNRDDALTVETELTKATELYSRLAAALEAVRRYDMKVTHSIRLEVESEAGMEADIDIS